MVLFLAILICLYIYIPWLHHPVLIHPSVHPKDYWVWQHNYCVFSVDFLRTFITSQLCGFRLVRMVFGFQIAKPIIYANESATIDYPISAVVTVLLG